MRKTDLGALPYQGGTSLSGKKRGGRDRNGEPWQRIMTMVKAKKRGKKD